MSPLKGLLLIAMIGYVVCGLSLCIGSKVYEWRIRWAILGVVILWPFLVAIAIKDGTFWGGLKDE